MDIFNRAGMFSDMPDDSHIVNLVEQDIDVGAFKTPSLRNIEKTGPYMHDGVYTTLWDVVAHYNFGGGTGSYSGVKESAVSPLLLTNREMDDIVEFLRSLSDGPPVATDLFPEGLVAAPVLPQ
jgi:cytochrome c peroxidase